MPAGSERDRAAGEAEEWLAARQRDSPLPVVRQTAPYLTRMRQGWAALHGCRTVALGFGGAHTGEIWYPSLSQWLRDQGYQAGTEEWARAEALIQAIDRVYVAHVNRPREEEPKPPKPDEE